ncbi:MAG: hypothetical protein ABI461_18975, partial [Polyangiaceae bacterium]
MLQGAAFGLEPTFWCWRDAVETFHAAADGAKKIQRVDVSRLAALLCSAAPVHAESTFFESIQRVPADCRVSINPRGKTRLIPNRRELRELTLSPVDAADEIWRLVVASVGRLTNCAKRVAILTGGGIDSSALLAAAIASNRGASERDVVAIALDFSGEGDDRPYLRDLQMSLGIQVLRVTPN